MWGFQLRPPPATGPAENPWAAAALSSRRAVPAKRPTSTASNHEASALRIAPPYPDPRRRATPGPAWPWACGLRHSPDTKPRRLGLEPYLRVRQHRPKPKPGGQMLYKLAAYIHAQFLRRSRRILAALEG